jgi:flagellar basal-body rod modification protein FlgD
MNTNLINLQNSTALSAEREASMPKDLGKEDFLKLLLTQLSNQDPLNPQDSTAFVAQLSQFAQVEGILNLGKKVDDLVLLSGANNAATSVSLLGKEVRVEGNTLQGSGTAFYELSDDASRVKMEIMDASGQVVKMIENLATSKGLHEVSVKDLEPGSYTFRMVALDSLGKEVSARLSVTEKIKGVNFTDGSPVMITESGKHLTPGQVSEIRQPLVL